MLELIGGHDIVLLLLLELLILLKRSNGCEPSLNLLFDEPLVEEDVDVGLHGLHVSGIFPELMHLMLHIVKLGHLVGNCFCLGLLVPLVLEDLLFGSSPKGPSFHEVMGLAVKYFGKGNRD